MCIGSETFCSFQVGGDGKFRIGVTLSSEGQAATRSRILAETSIAGFRVDESMVCGNSGRAPLGTGIRADTGS